MEKVQFAGYIEKKTQQLLIKFYGLNILHFVELDYDFTQAKHQFY